MHALIIEDDAVVAMLIGQLLADFGFASFDVAGSEEAAVEIASERRPDLITADVRLDGGSGVAAVDEIRKRYPVPVVYVTGNAASLDGSRVPVVAKPVDPEALTLAVRKALEESGRPKDS